MSNNKPWKNFERCVAKYFLGDRVVPSDTRSRGDVLHPALYLECKAYLSKHTVPAIVKLFDQMETQAELQAKKPVVVMRVKKSDKTGFTDLWVVDSDHLLMGMDYFTWVFP